MVSQRFWSYLQLYGCEIKQKLIKDSYDAKSSSSLGMEFTVTGNLELTVKLRGSLTFWRVSLPDSPSVWSSSRHSNYLSVLYICTSHLYIFFSCWTDMRLSLVVLMTYGCSKKEEANIFSQFQALFCIVYYLRLINFPIR